MRRLLDTLAAWWRWREVRASDLEIATCGDSGYVIAYTSCWFKRMISVQVDQGELLLLAEMIRHSVENGEQL